MSTVYLIPNDATYPAIGFAVTSSEQHDDTSQVTDFPLEDGSTISDDVIDQPREFAFEVIETNTPHETTWFGEGRRMATEIRSGASSWLIGSFEIPAGKDLVRDMWDRLRDLKYRRALFTVETSIESYPNMVITGLSLPRGEKSIGWGKYKITMRQIRIVTTATVSVPKPIEPRGKPQANKGKTTKKELSEADRHKAVENMKSTAAGLWDGDYNSSAKEALNAFGIGI